MVVTDDNLLLAGFQSGSPLPGGQGNAVERADALAHLATRRAVPSDLSLSFYDQLLSAGGVVQNGNAGDYRIILREGRDVTVNRDGSEYYFQDFVGAYILYSYLLIEWDGTTDTAGRIRDLRGRTIVRGNNYRDQHVTASIQSPPVPTSGGASYDLDGRALLTRWTGGTYDTEKASYEAIMTGQLNVDFSDGIVDGYLESDYIYRLPDPQIFDGGQEVLYRIPPGISREKFFGSDAAQSEVNSNLRIAIGRTSGVSVAHGRLIGHNEIYGAKGATFFTFGRHCGIRDCYAAELYVIEETGVFEGLIDPTAPLPQLGGENRTGHAIGFFAGPNYEEIFGHFSVQNTEPFGDMVRPLNRLEGFFVGAKQPESE